MKREHTNIVRFILEDCTPPAIRDLPILNSLFSKLSGINLKKCRQLRKSIPTLTLEQIDDFYKDYPRIHQGSDLSKKCVEQILVNVTGQSVCDVGCGTGYLLNQIESKGTFERLVGVDFSEHTEWGSLDKIKFMEHDILDLPFDDRQFDTVISTHTLEHILNIRAAFEELRRICKKKLVIVVPRERESIWSFNPHFHYFPYEHSFLKHLLPLADQWQINQIGRDYLYIETP